MFCRGCVLVPAPNLEDRRNFFHVTSVINLWGSPKCAVLRYFRLGCMSQSSPSPKTGRYDRNLYQTANFLRFQSSPSPKTGRYSGGKGYSSAQTVPILTQSEDWALSHRLQNPDFIGCVPILTQTEDWALFDQFGEELVSKAVPILTQSEDWALSNRSTEFRSRDCSNPHPVRRLGAMSRLFAI